jgi:hypothetical protein
VAALLLNSKKDAAGRYGYILAASNDSRNGHWKPRIEATDVMLRDVQARVCSQIAPTPMLSTAIL